MIVGFYDNYVSILGVRVTAYGMGSFGICSSIYQVSKMPCLQNIMWLPLQIIPWPKPPSYSCSYAISWLSSSYRTCFGCAVFLFDSISCSLCFLVAFFEVVAGISLWGSSRATGLCGCHRAITSPCISIMTGTGTGWRCNWWGHAIWSRPISWIGSLVTSTTKLNTSKPTYNTPKQSAPARVSEFPHAIRCHT